MIYGLRLLLVPFTFILLAGIYATGQSSKISRNAIDAAVEAFLKDFRADNPPVGFSVGIYKDGHSFIYNYGVADKQTGKRTTAKTLYEIASIAKTFAGTLLAQAAIEGRVKLDDDIRKYLVGEYPNLEFNGEPIRLFHLLNHRSGLPNWLPDTPALEPGKDKPAEWTDERIAAVLRDYTRDDFYRDLHSVKLTAPPGKYASYSNAGAMLLGYIFEKVYAKTFEELLKAKITGPLGMHDTVITLSPSQQWRLAKGYDKDGLPLAYTPDKVQAAGAIKTDVADMLKYAAFHLAEIDAAAKLTHQATWHSADSTYSAGLNWQMLASADSTSRLIWQSGNLAGFSAMCALYPEQKLGIIILTNKQRARLSATTDKLAHALDPKVVSFP